MNNSTIEISSKGLYSSWCYHKPSRTLFDCGEGFATHQGNFIYGIERVMISHGHGDHVLGLPSLIGCRNSARGDREKPLTIYYPQGDRLVENVKNFIELRNNKLSFKLTWIAIQPGYGVKINKLQEIVAFEMQHGRGLTLGYKIVETRSKLRLEYVGKDIPMLLRSGVNKDDLTVVYQATTFAYCLDAFNLNRMEIEHADVVVMDCTFIKDNDRDDNTHMTLSESYALCVNAGVNHMVAAHFSPRYLYPHIRDAIDKLNKEHGSNFVTPVYHNTVTEL